MRKSLKNKLVFTMKAAWIPSRRAEAVDLMDLEKKRGDRGGMVIPVMLHNLLKNGNIVAGGTPAVQADEGSSATPGPL